jgi:ribosomal protein S18 acetylase RimI-like enzyme
MKIDIQFSKNADLIASLNKPVQDLHVRLYPTEFKLFSHTETKTYIEKQLSDKNWFCYIANIDNVSVGYALFFIRNYEENPFRNPYIGIHVDQIAVSPEYKNKGIGKALMMKIEDFAIERNAKQIELTHWELNSEAKEFYEHIGFTTNFRFVVKNIL